MNKNKAFRVESLVRQTLGKTKLNCVRLPSAYFQVINRFTLPGADKQWEINFSPGEIIHIDPVNKVVRGFSPTNQQWKPKEISLVDLMQPAKYAIFKQNVKRLDPTQVKNKGIGYEDHVEFNTTVRALPKRADELGLEQGTKINVKVVE